MYVEGPCTLDDGLMPDDLFESVATDTAEETSGRQIGLIHRSGVPHMCTSKAPRACPAASQPTAQRWQLRSAFRLLLPCQRQHANAQKPACWPKLSLNPPPRERAPAATRKKRARDAQLRPEAHKRLLPSLLLLVTLRLRARPELMLGCEEQNQAKPSKAMQNNARQCKTKQSQANPRKTMQSNARQYHTQPNQHV